jgi:hypothetical protein
VGFTPQLVDLDRDGRTDIISGSWPGEIYFFRRQSDGTFAAAEKLKDRHGKEIRVGSASAAFAVDWYGNGTMDLVIGNMLGEVYVIPNEGKGKELTFGTPRRLEAAGTPIKVSGDAAPVVADWDGDGLLDLIVGTDEGNVVWYRNVGTRNAPKLEAARTLVAKSPVGWGGDDRRGPQDWGLRVKPCVVDWSGKGRLDLLVGDFCGGFNAKPSQTEAEKAEERKANDKLPALRAKWAETFKQYQQAGNEAPGETAAAKQDRLSKQDMLREELRRLNDELKMVQDIQSLYQPGYQYHGFVWHFQRLADAKKGP